MSSPNSDLPSYQSTSNLLSESLDFSKSRTGPGGDDLSLSELSIKDLPPKPASRPFSLFAQPSTPPPPPPPEVIDVPQDIVELGPDVQGNPDTKGHLEPKGHRDTVRTREEKLQQDLFILRKLNTAFIVHNETLRDCKSSTEFLSNQLHQTNVLLNRYISMLERTEEITRLLFDEGFEGGEEDDSTVARELQELEERKKREAEETERKEREREEREREQALREEAAQLERDRQQAKGRGRGATATRGSSGVTGVRGTRASMRGAASSLRGAGRPSALPTAPTARSRPSSANPGGSGIPTKRPVSSASTRSVASTRSRSSSHVGS